MGPQSPRGTSQKVDRGVQPASQNPYPIYDQNLLFPTLFMTYS